MRLIEIDNIPLKGDSSNCISYSFPEIKLSGYQWSLLVRSLEQSREILKELKQSVQTGSNSSSRDASFVLEPDAVLPGDQETMPIKSLLTFFP